MSAPLKSLWCVRWITAMALAVAAFDLSCKAVEKNCEDDSDNQTETEYRKLSDLPFAPGEKIYYTLRWGIFDVGRAVLEFSGPLSRDGEEVWMIEMTAETNSFADKIFKVRDYNAVWVDKEFTKPVYYVKNQNEGSTHHDVVVTFDWENNKAQYSDKGIARAPIDIEPGSWDPLAITYAVRNLDLNGLDHVSMPSTDGKKSTHTEINLSGPDSIRVPAGRFETIVLRPDTKDLGGVFKKSRNAGITIWFTNDARHLPIRMASKVIVGSFVAEMDHIEGPGSEDYNPPSRPKRSAKNAKSKRLANSD
jgi:hypothetical protein